MRSISVSELQKHNTASDCWVCIHNKVYDLTSFLDEHPGGSKIISKLAGKDGTVEFAKFHPPDMIERVGKDSLCVGEIEDSAKVAAVAEVVEDPCASRRAEAPHISRIINIADLEREAARIMTKEGWDYYASGADDELIVKENRNVFSRIRLRPRVCRDVSVVDTSTSILGTKAALPLYFTATALGRLAHPEGEVAIVKGAHQARVPYMLPTLSSCSLDDMLSALAPDQECWFQLYVNSDKNLMEKIVRRISSIPQVKALFITVDAPQLGRRERDMRNKPAAISDLQADDAEGLKESKQGVANALSSFIDPALDWERVRWLKTLTHLPVLLKGVQTWEDALLAYDAGLQGVVLSNHGGRQVDTCRSGVEVLVEVEEALRVKRNFRIARVGGTGQSTGMPLASASPPGGCFEVLVDGGVMRATDILKCVALGASGVGIGRAVLYGLAAYGVPGVVKVASLLQEEMRVAMSMMGARKVEQIVRSHVQLPNEAKL